MEKDDLEGGDLVQSVPVDVVIPAGGVIGLAEAAAWVASRDERLCHAVRWYQRLPERQGSAGSFARSQTLACDLRDHYRSELAAAEAQLMVSAEAGEIHAIGVRRGGGFQSIPEHDWIDGRIIFEQQPDTLAPASSRGGIHSELCWGLVKFKRAEIVKRWPALKPSHIAVVGTSKGEADTVKWLKAAFASDYYPMSEWAKAKFWEQQFKGKISARSFDRAWSNAASDFPERKAKGRRRTA